MASRAERIETMVESKRHFNAGKGSTQVPFADQAFLKSTAPLSHPVRNGAGRTLTLLDLIR